jgi:hypothetical protein
VAKKYKDKLKNRRDKIKNNKGYRKYIKRHPDNPNFITAVYCKGCGTQIKGLNSDNILIPYWNYREMTIEFNDGSAHMTPACVHCMNIKDKDVLEAIYISDLEEFDIEDDGKNEKAWDVYLDRIPTGIVKEKVKGVK